MMVFVDVFCLKLVVVKELEVRKKSLGMVMIIELV